MPLSTGDEGLSKVGSFVKSPELHVAGITIHKYESPKTGLRGLLLETGEPICQVHAVIATESDTHDWTHKDDGLPHTLEHAVFMGSELYPYKGVLDKLANRSLARGTNAWTATDHTCYTMAAAGHEGALNLLPIYADHILYPVLTDESFLTEVHHVTGEGEDKGVVYCEMQARENSAASLVDRAVLDLLYPEGGYSAETGGKMANLRKLSNAQVRRYHKEHYRPDNVVFVLSGTAGPLEFSAALEKIEQLVLSHGWERKEGVARPWSSPVAPMSIEVEESEAEEEEEEEEECDEECGVLTDTGMEGKPKQVEFPSEDQSTGVISLAWRGPKYSEHALWVQLQLLWNYLTESAISPLTKGLVEIEVPLCSRVAPTHEIFTEGYYQVWFKDAPTESIDWVVADFFAIVGRASRDFELDRMRLVIRRFRRKLLEKRERAPADAAMDGIILSFLYGPRASADLEMADLRSTVDVEPFLAEAEQLDTAAWQELLDRFILQPPCAAVIGKPSAELAKKIASDATALTAANAEQLGPDGLAAVAKKLEEAVAYNEREIPEELLTVVPIPSYSSVRPVPLLTIRGAKSLEVAPNSGEGVAPDVRAAVVKSLEQSRAQAGSAFDPYWVEWAHIESAFVSVSVALDTSALSKELRLHLPLLLELAFKLPCTLDDGTALTKDEVVSELQADTVRYSANFGLLNGKINQLVNFFVQVELEEGTGLELALKYIRRALYLTDISPEALRIGARRLLSLVPAAVRDGAGIARHLSHGLEFDTAKNNTFAAHELTQQPFLTRMINSLEDAKTAHHVVDLCYRARQELLKPGCMQIFVAADMRKLSDPYKQLVAAITPPPKFASAVPEGSIGAPVKEVAHSYIASRRAGQVTVAALSAIESNYLRSCAPGVAAYSDDHASLLVAIEYLTALEGDFWVKLRGAGLTYSYRIDASTDSQRLTFVLFKCTDMLGAYAAAKKIVVDYAKGETGMSSVALDAAKSTVAYSIIAGVSTRLSAASAAWSSTYEGKQVNYGRWLLQQMDKVTAADVLHSLKKYIVPLFDPSANVTATCPTNKLEDVRVGLAQMLEADVRALTEEQISQPGLLAASDLASRASTAPFAFAKQFKCECPKCVVPSAPAL